mmetsp:Transcript_2093/g.3074  ORF Transcript_2093/g.3074 Transcript_2093/m.3074 type:complete len:358 (-) Transcript_2093:91-1164(-)
MKSIHIICRPLLFFFLLSHCKALVSNPIAASPNKSLSSFYSKDISTHYHASKHRHSQTTSLMMSPSLISQQLVRTTLGVVLAYKISNRGLQRKSLSKSGATAAFWVSSVATSCSIRTAATLIMFYLTGSKLTSVGFSRKKTLEEDYSPEGSRGAGQVLACSLFGVSIALLRRLVVGVDGPLVWGEDIACLGNRLTLACVAFFACCAGDTWASELGILSKHPPRLVLAPWKSVPPGTDGAVSWVGLAASAAGGLCMGLTYGLFMISTVALREIISLAWIGTLGGLGGSLLDSILGYTIQATYYDTEAQMIVKQSSATTRREGIAFLSNEAVNFVSTAGTAALAALWAQPLLGIFTTIF